MNDIEELVAELKDIKVTLAELVEAVAAYKESVGDLEGAARVRTIAFT